MFQWYNIYTMFVVQLYVNRSRFTLKINSLCAVIFFRFGFFSCFFKFLSKFDAVWRKFKQFCSPQNVAKTQKFLVYDVSLYGCVKVCVFVPTIRRIDKAKIYKKCCILLGIHFISSRYSLKNILFYRTKVELLYIWNLGSVMAR